MQPIWAKQAFKLIGGYIWAEDTESGFLERCDPDPKGAADILKQHRSEWRDVHLSLILLRVFKRAQDWEACVEAIDVFIQDVSHPEKKSELLKKKAEFLRKLNRSEEAIFNDSESARLISLHRLSVLNDPDASDIEKMLVLAPEQAEKVLNKMWDSQ